MLILYADQLGYGLTHGEAFRTKARARKLGFENSNHTRRLAVDFNLFKNGKYLTRTSDHAELGKFWETLHPRAVWGGSWGDDGNHYSFEWQGVK